MDGADVWLSVRDRALRNPHIFQNALKVVRQSTILNIFTGTAGETQIPICRDQMVGPTIPLEV